MHAIGHSLTRHELLQRVFKMLSDGLTQTIPATCEVFLADNIKPKQAS